MINTLDVNRPDVIIFDEKDISASYGLGAYHSSQVYRKVMKIYNDPQITENDFWYEIPGLMSELGARGKFPNDTVIRSWIQSASDPDRTAIRPDPEKCVKWLEDVGLCEIDPETKLSTLRSSNSKFPTLNLFALFCLFRGSNVKYRPRISKKLSEKNLESLKMLKTLFESEFDLEFKIKPYGGTSILTPVGTGIAYLGRAVDLTGILPLRIQRDQESKRVILRSLPRYMKDLGTEFRLSSALLAYWAKGYTQKNLHGQYRQLRISVPAVPEEHYAKPLCESVEELFEEAVGTPFHHSSPTGGVKVYSVKSGEIRGRNVTLNSEQYLEAIRHFESQFDEFLESLREETSYLTQH